MASSTHTHTKKFQASTYQKHNIFENPIPKNSIFEQSPQYKKLTYTPSSFSNWIALTYFNEYHNKFFVQGRDKKLLNEIR